jgi:hypothetical protein
MRVTLPESQSWPVRGPLESLRREIEEWVVSEVAEHLAGNFAKDAVKAADLREHTIAVDPFGGAAAGLGALESASAGRIACPTSRRLGPNWHSYFMTDARVAD